MSVTRYAGENKQDAEKIMMENLGYFTPDELKNC